MDEHLTNRKSGHSSAPRASGRSSNRSSGRASGRASGSSNTSGTASISLSLTSPSSLGGLTEDEEGEERRDMARYGEESLDIFSSRW